MYRTTLVGCDGSDHAQDALALAAMVAQHTGASVTTAALGGAAQQVPTPLVRQSGVAT